MHDTFVADDSATVTKAPHAQKQCALRTYLAQQQSAGRLTDPQQSLPTNILSIKDVISYN